MPINNYSLNNEKEQTKNTKTIDEVIELCEQIYKGEIGLDYIKQNYKKYWFGTYRQYFLNAWYDYQKDNAKTPEWRYNLLICGEGGSGKTTVADILSRILTKEEPFQFTDIESGFLNYYKQNAIIWDEMRIKNIKNWGIERFLRAMNNGNKNNFFLNIKYGNVLLLNNYNFITTSQEPWKFLEGLTDKYYIRETNELTESENSNQITRRLQNFLWFKKVENEGIVNTIIETWKFKSNNPEKWEDRYEMIERVIVENTNSINFLEKLVPIIKKLAKEIEIEVDSLKEISKNWKETETKNFTDKIIETL